jgi:hypothetical protein
MHTTDFYGYIQLLRTKDGGLGLAYLSEPLQSELAVQLWERRSNFSGVVGWVLLHKAIPLEGMLPPRVVCGSRWVSFVGYDEDGNVIVLDTMIGNFTLQLDSMEIKHIVERDKSCHGIFYPYRNFYTAVNIPHYLHRTCKNFHLISVSFQLLLVCDGCSIFSRD